MTIDAMTITEGLSGFMSRGKTTDTEANMEDMEEIIPDMVGIGVMDTMIDTTTDTMIDTITMVTTDTTGMTTTVMDIMEVMVVMEVMTDTTDINY